MNTRAMHNPDLPRALVVRTAGTNCDAEMARAFAAAGAEVDLVHVDRLIAEPRRVDEYRLIGLPGGFSYGDDIASGRVLGMKARTFLYPAFASAVDRGAAIIGVCNGMQVLAQMGLLPGEISRDKPPDDEPPSPEPPPQTIALTDNADARFIDQWLRVEIAPNTRCVWTRDLYDGNADQRDRIMRFPIAHGEGRFVPASDDLLATLESRGQVAMRYIDNANGSVGGVAGVCDATGRVFGLMPHPERCAAWRQHPFWTRLDPAVFHTPPPGLRVFRNAVEHVEQSSAATA